MVSGRKFKPAGTVLHANFSKKAPSFAVRPRRRGARGRGILYEEKAQVELENRYPITYLPSPWIIFKEAETPYHRWCQPDGLIIDPWKGRLTIVEIKYKHNELAWWQMFELYAPVLRLLFPFELWGRFSCCEVVNWYDPSVSCPAASALSRVVDKVPPGAFGVHIWNKR